MADIAFQSEISPVRGFSIEKPILFDARKILDGGVGVYSQNAISDLVRRQVPLVLLGKRDQLNAFPWVKDLEVIEESAKQYSRDELFSSAKRIPFQRFSLFHLPHYSLPFRISIPTVVTIHDLIHLTHPEKFYYPFIAWPLIASTLWRANTVITVSESARRDIVRIFPMANKKISVISNRLNDSFLERSVETDNEFGDYFFVSTSQAKPHKGVLDLLYAFCSAKEKLEALVARGAAPQHALSIELVIAGFGSEKLLKIPEYQKLIENRSDIRVIGSLDTTQLKKLYAHARAVIVPSRIEGFGLPVLEAHAMGTPVIIRPVPALLELQQPGDFVAKDFSIEQLSHTLIHAMKVIEKPNVDQRDQLKDSVNYYNSDTTADKLIEIYQKTLTK